MKSPVKKITILWAEGKHSYCSQFPKEFNSFEECSKFFLSNQHNYTEGGYDKHGMKVEWENGDEYSYRADIAHPRGNCYHSEEYYPERRIKLACFNRIKMFESGQQGWGDTEESIKELKEFMNKVDLGEMTQGQLSAICAADDLTRKNNERDQQIMEARREFEEAKMRMYDHTEVEPAKNEKQYEVGKYRVRHSAGKNGYLVIEGTEKNHEFGESYPIRRVYQVGSEATCYEYGTVFAKIKSITEKNVVLESDRFYKSKTKREEIKYFVPSNADFDYSREA
jgi:hypothetical protein